jgi:hypothetical protein
MNTSPSPATRDFTVNGRHDGPRQWKMTSPLSQTKDRYSALVCSFNVIVQNRVFRAFMIVEGH